MTTYISLLRGINVSGHRTIPMDALKKCYVSIGYSNPQHYIQSGNIVFSSNEKDSEKIADKITKAIAHDFGFEVPVLVRSNTAWQELIHRNPFLKNKDIDIAFLHACLLEDTPNQKSLEIIGAGNYGQDRFELAGNIIYLFCPGGYGKTRLNNNFWESKLKTRATTRNWKTIQQLAVMAEQFI